MAAETGLSYFHKTAFSSNKSLLKTIKNQTLPRIGMTNTFNKASMFDIKNSVVQMTPEHNDLEFNPFNAVLDKVSQRHASIKSAMFDQTRRLL